MAVFDDLRHAVDDWRAAQEETREARVTVVVLVRAAHEEGIPLAVIARAAGLTMKEARTMVRD